MSCMDLLQRVTESLKAFELWTVCTRVLKTSDCFEDPFCLKCFVCFNWCIPLYNFYSFLSSSVQFRSNSQKSVVLVVKPASLKHCFFKKSCFSSSIGISSSSPNHLTFFQSSILSTIILSTPVTILM